MTTDVKVGLGQNSLSVINLVDSKLVIIFFLMIGTRARKESKILGQVLAV